MKVKLVAIFIMVGILFTIALGCGKAEGANITNDTQKSIEVTIDEFMQNNHIGKTVELKSGGTLNLILGSNPTTGFSWSEQAQISDKAILEQTQHQYQEPASKDGGTVVGAAGKEVWTFKTLKSGTSEISLGYSRPWEGGEKSEWTLTLNVTAK